MIKKISKTEEIKTQLQNDGKVTKLDQPGHVAAIEAMNRQMQQVRREFQVKDRNSQINAARVILTS